jgi:hypothetical protein
MNDRGGTIITVPVAYFNNEGGWKKQFPNPKTTYIVAQVMYTNLEDTTHEICFLGAPESDNFFINDEVYIQFRALWEAHGRRMTPTYEVSTNPIDVDDSPDRPEKNRGMNSRLMFLKDEHTMCARMSCGV